VDLQIDVAVSHSNATIKFNYLLVGMIRIVRIVMSIYKEFVMKVKRSSNTLGVFVNGFENYFLYFDFFFIQFEKCLLRDQHFKICFI
jgi:hypothetical protein